MGRQAEHWGHIQAEAVREYESLKASGVSALRNARSSHYLAAVRTSSPLIRDFAQSADQPRYR